MCTLPIQRLALGFSKSSLPLLNRLKSRNHCEYIALTPGAASELENPPNQLLIASAAEVLEKYWSSEGVLLIVGAIGAAIRLIAPLLGSKDIDPAVLVIDSKANYVVPLIGGHKAGAEKLAFLVAADLGAIPVITSDSNCMGRLALDSFGKDWGWRSSGKTTQWNELMFSQARGVKCHVEQFSGSTLWLESDAAKSSFELSEEKTSLLPKVFISPYKTNNCSWHPPTVWIGVGCERSTSYELLKTALEASLNEIGIAIEAVAGLASVDIKSDEKCLLSLSKIFNWPIRFFSKELLSTVEVPNPSLVVEQAIGTPSVAESAALLAADNPKKLLLNKRIFSAHEGQVGAVTLAIANSDTPFAPDQGELHLVGSGPGDLSFMTQDARAALSRSVVWIGYSRYLDLVEPLRRADQVRIDSQLTNELLRCKRALELAKQGVKVSLISSGDSGIYGMAGLALELWLEDNHCPNPLFEVHPGISALQVAAAKLGAPIMHDFCAISLSDCLTNWSVIERRLEAAAAGDFVVAIYNPRSQNRDWQLLRAIEIFLAHREAKTPVALARQLGREEEEVQLHTLSEFPVNKVDMLSLILLGNSSTRISKGRMVTPRGY